MLSRVVKRLRREFVKLLVGLSECNCLEKVGSEYGGWIVPTNQITADSICYCAGVGEDITFDLELIRRFSCSVFAFDPTPRSKVYVEITAATLSKYHFRNVGIWSSNDVVRFFAPRNSTDVSHSILNLQHTDQYFDAQCMTLATLMSQLGHDHIDLLKMDIEGAEHEVIQSLVNDKINVNILCVEFNQPMSARTILATIRNLKRNGLRPVSRDGWNYTFVRNMEKT